MIEDEQPYNYMQCKWMKEAPSKDTLHKNKQVALPLEIKVVVALGSWKD